MGADAWLGDVEVLAAGLTTRCCEGCGAWVGAAVGCMCARGQHVLCAPGRVLWPVDSAAMKASEKGLVAGGLLSAVCDCSSV
jgi:hypothetical protein